MTSADYLAKLGGGDLDVLTNTVPSARNRFAQMGLVLIATASVAGISMYFALHDAVRVHWLPAMLVAACWMLLILNLDRVLIVSMAGVTSLPRLLMLALPRLALACLIGAVVSTPLTLRLFESDIDFVLGQTNAAASISNKETVANSPQQKTVDDLNSSLLEQRNILEGVVPLKTGSAEVKAIQRELTRLQERLPGVQHASEQADILVQCEGYGGGREDLDDPSRCAAKPGFNGNYDRYEAEAEVAAKALADLKDEITRVQSDLSGAEGSQRAASEVQLAALQEDAPAKIDKLEDQLAVAEANLETFTIGLANEAEGNRGLLARLRALSEVTETDPLLDLAHKLLWALFAAIELLPILVKILSSIGPRSAYDEAVALRDLGIIDTARMRRAANNRVEQDKVDVMVEAEKNMRGHEIVLAKEANVKVADAMRTVMDSSLTEWQKQVVANISVPGRQP
ncbi:protein of unknown function [Nocardioides alpinus]|uniref:DUF4407 domain-containing protein n=1 Tax=Nocardioides alpinus TaxID=748909 RepID=A0A1I1B4E8_9ACTN|nr:DUF4407 domain-containing protein [Nocardioides alpinus]PKH40158.1 DUF4407 domain-containing protein [Nocardioides alpinus]SFB44642.1 protein of unknown function [Nocardioides alpinus]